MVLLAYCVTLYYIPAYSNLEEWKGVFDGSLPGVKTTSTVYTEISCLCALDIQVKEDWRLINATYLAHLWTFHSMTARHALKNKSETGAEDITVEPALACYSDTDILNQTMT